MNVEIKNWLGVVVLLCLGFILGKITASPGVNATPQESQVGRYQLVVGEFNWRQHEVDKTSGLDTMTTVHDKRLVRIDTVTGEVEYYAAYEIVWAPDTITWTNGWDRMTGKLMIPPGVWK